MKEQKLDRSSPEVAKPVKVINSVAALIPEVVALETKLGMIKGFEKDLFLDQIIEHLRRNSLFGKLWENAEKARQESVDSMAKDDDEK